MVWWEWTEGIVLEPVVDGLAQKIKDHTDMIPKIKDFVQVQAIATKEKTARK
jgi:hypothetical protein